MTDPAQPPYKNAACPSASAETLTPSSPPSPPTSPHSGGGRRTAGFLAPVRSEIRDLAMASLRAVATRFLRPAAIAADGLPFLAPMTASGGDSYFISYRSTACMGPLDLTIPRPSVLDIIRESAPSMTEVVRQARLTFGTSQCYKIDPMLLFALGLGGYLFAKDHTSEDSGEELSDIDILKRNLKSWIGKLKEKNRLVDKKIKELEEKEKQMKEKADLGDQNAKEGAREVEKRLVLLHRISEQLRGCLDAANSGKDNKDGPILKLLKLAFKALKLPLLLMGYAGTADELLVLWGAIFLLCSGTAYYTMDNFWELVEEKKKALKLKAWRLLGLAPDRAKCFCDIEYPVVCAHCGRELPEFEHPKSKVMISSELLPSEVTTPSEHKENGANGKGTTSCEHKDDGANGKGTTACKPKEDGATGKGTTSCEHKNGSKVTGTATGEQEGGKASGTTGGEV